MYYTSTELDQWSNRSATPTVEKKRMTFIVILAILLPIRVFMKNVFIVTTASFQHSHWKHDHNADLTKKQNTGMIYLDFYQTWQAPCKFLAPSTRSILPGKHFYWTLKHGNRGMCLWLKQLTETVLIVSVCWHQLHRSVVMWGGKKLPLLTSAATRQVWQPPADAITSYNIWAMQNLGFHHTSIAKG